MIGIHSFHDVLEKGFRVLESYTECQKASSQQMESVQTMIYVAKPLLQAIEVQSTFIPRVQSFPQLVDSSILGGLVLTVHDARRSNYRC